MTTVSQLKRFGRKIKIRSRSKNSPALGKCPQKKGVCLKIIVRSPKKPNSARRQVSKVKLSNKTKLMAYIPGQIHRLQEHSQVMVRGGRCPDVPGVNYHLVRGKYDFAGLDNRKSSRSKYGTKKKLYGR